ncbi:hypothetical protein SAY86_014705 [Trapa natans]|uniref:Uncharacterized protein n=1 Tax=Trapa natans TaxID=22666 RepID=A0AAN7QGI3_TRANT|nr:hypothetical protein SAY86_014705 [Trapa natans]
MERSNGGVGLIAVCAVSWSVAMIALQAHRRLLSDFMKKMDSQLHEKEAYGSSRVKKVRFAEDVVEPSSNNKEYRRSRGRRNKEEGTSRSANINSPVGSAGNRRAGHKEEEEEDWATPTTNMLECIRADACDGSRMPMNRQALYRGIIENRMLKGPTNLPRHFY